jgi:hypothetical protein
MMMRYRLAFLLLLGLALPARAQVTTSHLILPSYGGTNGLVFYAAANTLYCYRLPARLGITNATKIAGAVVSSSSSCTTSWAIYPDDDAGTALAILTASCTTAGIKTATGLTPFSLVQGTIYRFCGCMTKTDARYLGIAEHGTAGMTKGDILSPGSVRAGTATNACSTGVAPTTTGTISTVTTQPVPMMLVEN